MRDCWSSSVISSPENHLGTLDYSVTGIITRQIVKAINQKYLSSEIVLKYKRTLPARREDQGFLVSLQGLRGYRDRLDKRLDLRGHPYYWIGGDVPNGVPDEETDIGPLEKGYVSVHLLHLDLTSYSALENMMGWDWELSEV